MNPAIRAVVRMGIYAGAKVFAICEVILFQLLLLICSITHATAIFTCTYCMYGMLCICRWYMYCIWYCMYYVCIIYNILYSIY